MLQKEFTGTRWEYEGFIIDFDAEPRVFAPRIGPRRNAFWSMQQRTKFWMLFWVI